MIHNLQPKIFKRSLAYIIDYAVQFGYFFISFRLEDTFIGEKLAVLSIFLFWLLMLPVLEYLTGQSVGKKLVGLRVVSINSPRISFGQAFKRRILDPIELWGYGLVAIIAIKLTPNHQRLGDMWANTLVIGGEKVNCRKCFKSLYLEPDDVIKSEFICPHCDKKNIFN